jgi:hypothetical protein
MSEDAVDFPLQRLVDELLIVVLEQVRDVHLDLGSNALIPFSSLF